MQTFMTQVKNEIFKLKLDFEAFSELAKKENFAVSEVEDLVFTIDKLYKDYSINETRNIPLTTAKKDAFIKILGNVIKKLDKLETNDAVLRHLIAKLIVSTKDLQNLIRKLRTKDKKSPKR